MEIVKKTDKYLFVKKRNGRYGVKTLRGQWINGEDKVKLLAAEGFIKVQEKKAEEAPAEEAAEETTQEAAPEEASPAE